MARPRNAIRPVKLSNEQALRPTAKRAGPPFPFILEALAPLNPEVKRMFGGFAVYVGDKIVFMLRDSLKFPIDNGLWLVLEDAFDASTDPDALRADFPSLRAIQLLGGVIKHWILMPSDAPDFESGSLQLCDLVLAHDPRIGRIPESRKTSRKPSRKPL
jgi:hypothetical protein